MPLFYVIVNKYPKRELFWPSLRDTVCHGGKGAVLRATLSVAAGVRDVIWQQTGSRDASEACPCDSPLPARSHNLPENHQLGPAIETWASTECRDLSPLDG